MIHSILKPLFFVFLASSLLGGCARQGAPTGGPKDTAPPQMDTLNSTPNYRTNSNPKEIILKFDEWVVLADAPNQIIVSPPLAKRADYSLKGKSVVVKLDEAEVLRPNTTYTIQFGTGVKDFHADNPAKDLRFVFSTGDVIDSLSMNGTVVDAFTGEPVEKASVLLYDVLADSVIRKERPYYIGKTDKSGAYQIQNVKAGIYKLVAIDDINQDLKWSGESEKLAFSDTALTIAATNPRVPTLRIFKNKPTFRSLEKNASRYGLIKLGYSANPISIRVNPLQPVEGLELKQERVADSIYVWYDLNPPTEWALLAGNDTVRVKALDRKAFMDAVVLSFAESAPAGGRKTKKLTGPPPIKNINTVMGKQVSLVFNRPLESIDTSKWIITVDSMPFKAFKANTDTSLIRTLQINALWKDGKTHMLRLLPGAVSDMYGNLNRDTLTANINVISEKQLGTLNLTIKDLVPSKSYLIQLLNGAELMEERVFVAKAAEEKLVFKNLQVATYTARLIKDGDSNGQWDTGNYTEHLQPETILTRKLDPLRPNWELEATIGNDEKGTKKRIKDE